MFRHVCPAFVFLCVLTSVVVADGSVSSRGTLRLRGIVAAKAEIEILTPRSEGTITSEISPANRSPRAAVTTIAATTNSRTGCSLSVSSGSSRARPAGLIVNGKQADFVDGTIHLATLRRTVDGTGDSVSITVADAGSTGETLWLDIVVP